MGKSHRHFSSNDVGHIDELQLFCIGLDFTTIQSAKYDPLVIFLVFISFGTCHLWLVINKFPKKVFGATIQIQ